jgi:hypothetical protein
MKIRTANGAGFYSEENLVATWLGCGQFKPAQFVARLL